MTRHALALVLLGSGCREPATKPTGGDSSQTTDSVEDSAPPSDTSPPTDSEPPPDDTGCTEPIVEGAPDADGDGFGDPDLSASFCGTLPKGWVPDATDCDDTDPATHPGAEDTLGNEQDENCDGVAACGKGRVLNDAFLWGITGDPAAQAAEFCANYDAMAGGLEAPGYSPDSFIGLECVCGVSHIGSINSDALVNFRGLESVSAVPGSVSVANAPLLESFEGLDNVRSIGILEATYYGRHGVGVPSLTSFSGLDRLEEVTWINVDFYGTDLRGLGALRSAETITLYAPNLVSFEGLDAFEGTTDYFQLSAEELVSFHGLESRTTIRGWLSVATGALVSLDGLQNLTSLGGLGLGGCPTLENLDGLTSLTEIDGHGIYLNGLDQFSSLARLGALADFRGSVLLYYLPRLTSLDGLQVASELDELTLYEMELPDLVGLDNVTAIRGDLTIEYSRLETAHGLESLREIDGDLTLTDNYFLDDITALHAVEWIGGDVLIDQNDLSEEQVQDFIDAVGRENIAGVIYGDPY